MLDLTIVIPVRNESANLKGCLESIGDDFARSVVVVDSDSDDSTVEIAETWGAEVLNFQWNGKFPKKRNWYLQNHPPTTRWVLFLDADEYLTAAFKSEVTAKLASSKHRGYWLRYSIYFLGKELKYGYPLRKLALFEVGSGEYERIDENAWSRLDMEIHEHPEIEGSVGEIKSKIDHRDFRDLSHYVAKHNEYSSWEAHRYLAKQLNKAGEMQKMTLMQRIKYRLVGSPFGGVIYFLGAYFVMRGFLDGTRGFVFAILKMGYFTQVYCKIRELRSLPSPKM